MPIYEYQCDACGKRSEVIQKIGEAPLAECPQCGETKLRKLISAAAFRLKGGGWYETDFKDKKARKNVAAGEDSGGSKAADKSEGGKEEKKSEPATPAKPEAKTESTPAKPKAAGE